MDRKTDLMVAIQTMRALEKEFIDSISPEERLASGTLQRWSARGVLAHLAAWGDKDNQQIAAVLRGEKPQAFEDLDAINARIYADHAQRPWDELTAYLNRTAEQLVQILQGMDAAALDDAEHYHVDTGRPLWRYIAGNEIFHPASHLAAYCLEHNRMEMAEKIQLQSTRFCEQIDASPDFRGVAVYNLACFYALAGQKERAISYLGQSLKLNPSLTEWSKEDSDLISLRDDPAYQLLYNA